MGSSKSLAVFAAGAALMVSGCTGGEPEADPTPIFPESSEPADPSPSPSESEAAEVEAPEMPDAARERTFDGAEAFIEYWAETVTHALNTGETDELERISERGCESCTGSRGVIDDVYGGGGRIDSEGWVVNELGFAGNREMDVPVATFDRGREVVRRVDEPAETFPPASTTLEFRLRWVNDEWVIRDFTTVV